MSKTDKKIKELAQEIDILDHMLSALVEILEEKGIMTTEEMGKKNQSKNQAYCKNSAKFQRSGILTSSDYFSVLAMTNK